MALAAQVVSKKIIKLIAVMAMVVVVIAAAGAGAVVVVVLLLGLSASQRPSGTFWVCGHFPK